MARIGALLVVLGFFTAGFGALWQIGLVPGSRMVLPAPVALQMATPQPTVGPPTPISIPTELLATPVPVPTAVAELAVAEPPRGLVVASTAPPDLADAPESAPARLATPAIHLTSADAADRIRPALVGGYALRLTIPSIQLDTPVKQGGIVADAKGDPAWETRPFVAVHYGDLTSLVGLRGNAVIAGHVVTINEGNVFRLLYKVNIGDEVHVWDDHDRELAYRVVDVQLVSPAETWVMDPTLDETLTLITCGGTFNPRTREFSDRLIVTAKPL